MTQRLFILCAILLMATGFCLASMPSTINYQGKLLDNKGEPVNGTKQFIIELRESGVDTLLETWTKNGVSVVAGMYSIELTFDKDYFAMNQISQNALVLRVSVDGETMVPDKTFDAVPYAQVAENGFPKGTVIMWSSSVTGGNSSIIPAGWAVCDGLPHTYNGRTTTTPDLKGRFIVGVGTTNNVTYEENVKGGIAKTVLLLSANQMPAHNHGGITDSAGEHTHTHADYYPGGYTGSSYGVGNYYPTDYPMYLASWINGFYTNSVSHGHVIPSQGGSAHENRPPYYVLYYIMKL